MTHPNKRRGCDLEREVVCMAQAAGLPARRAWGSDGRAAGWHQEVDALVAGMRIQCKRRRKLPTWLGLSDNVDGVVIREDRGDAYILMPLTTALTMMKHSYGGTP